MEKTCGTCKWYDNCDKFIGLVWGFCETDWEPNAYTEEHADEGGESDE